VTFEKGNGSKELHVRTASNAIERHLPYSWASKGGLASRKCDLRWVSAHSWSTSASSLSPCLLFGWLGPFHCHGCLRVDCAVFHSGSHEAIIPK
jgi:hypothetical protein